MSTINQIAAELGVDIETAESFMTKVRQMVGIPVKYVIILDVLKHFEDPKQATPEVIASLTQMSQIAASLNLNINTAREFVTKIEELVGTPLKHEVILNTLKHIKYQKKAISPETVASLIQAAPVIASVLKVDINAVKDFVGEVWQLAGMPVKSETILDILKIIKDTTSITPETIVSLIQIASKLDVDIPTAESFVAKVGQLTGRQYKHPVIVFVLKQMKNLKQATPELVACLLQITTALGR